MLSDLILISLVCGEWCIFSLTQDPWLERNTMWAPVALVSITYVTREMRSGRWNRRSISRLNNVEKAGLRHRRTYPETNQKQVRKTRPNKQPRTKGTRTLAVPYISTNHLHIKHILNTPTSISREETSLQTLAPTWVASKWPKIIDNHRSSRMIMWRCSVNAKPAFS
jgi:hypothetical protein